MRKNPVLLIHGIDDTTALFRRMSAFLRREGWLVHSVDLIPNNGDAGLDRLAEQIGEFVDATFDAGQHIDLVGFSMGGLVARYYVQRLDGVHRVERLVTISSPHRGTWTGYLRGNAGARQMRPKSKFLSELNVDAEVLKRIRFTSIWTPLDLMILPAKSSVMLQARSVRITVAAHPLMAQSRRVLREVVGALSEAGQDQVPYC